MSIRNPRFTYHHLIRDTHDDIFSAGTTAFDASFPRTRLSDDRRKLLAGPTAGSAQLLIITNKSNLSTDDRKRSQPADLNRLLIPKGHNIGGIASIRSTFNAAGDEVLFENVELSDGADRIFRQVPASEIFSLEYKPGTIAENNGLAPCLSQQIGMSGTFGSVAQRLGEFVIGKTFETVLGVDPRFSDFVLPTGEGIKTRSGESFFNQTGEPLRMFTLDHVVDEGVDSRMYDDMIRRTGVRRNPIYYEAPVDAEENDFVVHDFQTLSGITSSETVANFGTALTGVTGITQYLRATALNTGAQTIQIDFASPIDLRDCVLQLDTLIPSAYWPTLSSHERIRLIHGDSVGAIESTMFSRYEAWRALIPESGADSWSRVFVDLDNDTTAADPQGPADLERIVRMQMEVNWTVGDQKQFSNMRAVRKAALPVPVEIVSYSKRQVGRNPAVNPLWRYEFEFAEVSA